ncbi:RidA family protein [Caballeronia sp. GACF4]|uniref:RidA family protein n=1 Tax=Caballeronia sp. GACF4 TaxID=2921763 RepID=UPI002029420C|nr:RidA family protein [Caballeronia sp. GACF4]
MNSSNASTLVTPVRLFGNLAFVSGQLPREAGELTYRGKVGEEIAMPDAEAAAALCAHACLAALERALGSREKIAAVLKLTGFVACSPDFTAQGKVIDAASRVLIDALGSEVGGHARSAIGVQQLPHGAPVEVELIVGLK